MLFSRILVYTLSATPQRLLSLDTAPNPRGIFALASGPSAILAFPARTKGQIAVIDLSRTLADAVKGTKGPTPAATLIPAHSSRISCLALSSDGSKLASASEKGTLVRVYGPRSARLLAELRRGVDRADIYSITFNPAGTRLCVSSDKGTVHVFNLAPPEGLPSVSGAPAKSSASAGAVSSSSTHDNNDDTHFDPADPDAEWPSESAPNGPAPIFSMPSLTTASPAGNRQSHLSFLPSYLLPKYFSSEWSFARFSLPSERRCLAAFVPSSHNPAPEAEGLESLLVVCADGAVYKVAIDPVNGGEGTVQWFARCVRGNGRWGGVDEKEFFEPLGGLEDEPESPPPAFPATSNQSARSSGKPSPEPETKDVKQEPKERIYPKVEELLVRGAPLAAYGNHGPPTIHLRVPKPSVGSSQPSTPPRPTALTSQQSSPPSVSQPKGLMIEDSLSAALDSDLRIEAVHYQHQQQPKTKKAESTTMAASVPHLGRGKADYVDEKMTRSLLTKPKPGTVQDDWEMDL